MADLCVMILNGVPISKICGFANTDSSYLTAKGEKHLPLESELTRGAFIGPRQAPRVFIFTRRESFIPGLGYVGSMNSWNPPRQTLCQLRRGLGRRRGQAQGAGAARRQAAAGWVQGSRHGAVA